MVDIATIERLDKLQCSCFWVEISIRDCDRFLMVDFCLN